MLKLMLLLRRQCVIMRYLLPLSVLLLQRRARGPARQQLHARWSTQRSAKNEQMMQLQRPDAMQLKLLIDAYVRPLQRDAQGLRREEVVRVFSNVEEILDVNELLLGRLEVTAAAESAATPMAK